MRLALLLLTAGIFTAPLSAVAQVESDFWNGGGMRVGTSTTTCDSSVRGALRFNDTSKEIELCNGADWTHIVNAPISAPVAPVGSGYFVLTATTWDGNLGGQDGGDAKCLAELTGDTNWKYYAAADGDGQLVTGNVKAFICDNNTLCSGNLMPLTTYYFGRVGDIDAGGASFTTDASGIGPGDSTAWSGVTYFSGTYTYWTNRANGTATAWSANGNTAFNNGNSCHAFSSNVQPQALVGVSTSTTGGRWNSAGSACSNTHPLICVVNP